MRVDELTGASIGRYRLGGRLQVLPYATIHRGNSVAGGDSVLVWTFRDPYATAAGFLEALQTLAGDRRARQVPGVLHVLEIGNHELRDPLVYLVTEDATAGFLVSLLQAGRAPGVFATTGRLARTLDQMHALGMVHGDIQPATVAITAAGPVLAGHSIRTVVSRVTPEAAWIDITRSFRPPEVPTGAEPTIASDLWGLGALVYYLLVGRPPAPDGALEPPSRLRPQLPERVDQAVMRALAADPDHRFPRASEFYTALRGPQAHVVHRPEPRPAEPAIVPSRPAPKAEPSPAASMFRVPQQPERVPAGEQWVPDALAGRGRAPGPPPAPASSRWPTEVPLTPAALRAEALPRRTQDNGTESPGSESTQLIAMEPYRFEPKFRRRGGYVVLWALVAAVVAGAVLLVTGRLGI